MLCKLKVQLLPKSSCDLFKGLYGGIALRRIFKPLVRLVRYIKPLGSLNDSSSKKAQFIRNQDKLLLNRIRMQRISCIHDS